MNISSQQSQIGRRNFIKAVAATPFAGALIWKATSMRPVRTGIVGIGGQGGVLLENSPSRHIRISAVCDIFPPNREKALKLAHDHHDPEAQAYENFEEMLNRDDLEAVIIATPLWMHARMTVAALKAGKHVFCEKNMAKTIEECHQMNEAAREARRVLQIGHQRTYNPLYQQARSLVQNGEIGDVYHIRAAWHRNNDWRRSVPKTDFDPSPWGYQDLEHLKNWRLYEKHSLGLMAELGSHQIQVVNWFSNSVPRRVLASGGIYRFADGREVPDHVYLIYEYPDDLTLTYSSVQSNKWDHYYELIMGTEGTILLSGEREALLFYEDSSRNATALKTETVAEDQAILSASASRARDAAGSETAGTTAEFDALMAYRLELEGFARSIRHGDRNLCDGQEGARAAVATIAGYQAIETGEPQQIAPEAYGGAMLS